VPYPLSSIQHKLVSLAPSAPIAPLRTMRGRMSDSPGCRCFKQPFLGGRFTGFDFPEFLGSVYNDRSLPAAGSGKPEQQSLSEQLV
jgi:hypothetical protein